jgi:hypothetical protein
MHPAARPAPQNRLTRKRSIPTEDGFGALKALPQFKLNLMS